MLAARGEAACTRGAGFHCAHKDLITLSSAQTCSKLSWQASFTQAICDIPIVAGLLHQQCMIVTMIRQSWQVSPTQEGSTKG